MTEEFASGLYTGIVIAILVIGWAFIAAHIMGQTTPDDAESTLTISDSSTVSSGSDTEMMRHDRSHRGSTTNLRIVGTECVAPYTERR